MADREREAKRKVHSGFLCTIVLNVSLARLPGTAVGEVFSTSPKDDDGDSTKGYLLFNVERAPELPVADRHLHDFVDVASWRQRQNKVRRPHDRFVRISAP